MIGRFFENSILYYFASSILLFVALLLSNAISIILLIIYLGLLYYSKRVHYILFTSYFITTIGLTYDIIPIFTDFHHIPYFIGFFFVVLFAFFNGFSVLTIYLFFDKLGAKRVISIPLTISSNELLRFLITDFPFYTFGENIANIPFIKYSLYFFPFIIGSFVFSFFILLLYDRKLKTFLLLALMILVISMYGYKVYNNNKNVLEKTHYYSVNRPLTENEKIFFNNNPDYILIFPESLILDKISVDSVNINNEKYRIYKFFNLPEKNKIIFEVDKKVFISYNKNILDSRAKAYLIIFGERPFLHFVSTKFNKPEQKGEVKALLNKYLVAICFEGYNPKFWYPFKIYSITGENKYLPIVVSNTKIFNKTNISNRLKLTLKSREYEYGSPFIVVNY